MNSRTAPALPLSNVGRDRSRGSAELIRQPELLALGQASSHRVDGRDQIDALLPDGEVSIALDRHWNGWRCATMHVARPVASPSLRTPAQNNSGQVRSAPPVHCPLSTGHSPPQRLLSTTPCPVSTPLLHACRSESRERGRKLGSDSRSAPSGRSRYTGRSGYCSSSTMFRSCRSRA